MINKVLLTTSSGYK